MKAYARDCWNRAEEAAQLAEDAIPISPDGAASRAYYAAFHAVSALFALRGQTFTKHTAVDTAVHRDLVKPGHWPKELGKHYSDLWELRTTGDYGGLEHVTAEDARSAVEMARAILEAVRTQCPELEQPA